MNAIKFGAVTLAAVALAGCASTPTPTPTVTVTTVETQIIVQGGSGNVSTFLAFVREDTGADFTDYNDGMILDMLDTACTMSGTDYRNWWRKHEPENVAAILEGIENVGWICHNVVTPWDPPEEYQPAALDVG